ncbi:MAG: hypothetical protein WD795_02385 [Woeseia sp.]
MTIVLFFGTLLVAGCQGANDQDAVVAPAGSDSETPSQAPSKAQPIEAQTSPGKPSAPITIDYTVIGSPIVGQPVSINLEVSSSMRDRPITLNYRVNDARDMTFPQAQPQRIALAAFGDAERAAQQITVVPQREGRLYLNVSAEVETEGGTLLKSMAIPIQVGDAPRQQQTNGELKEDDQGEPVISMPAEENTPD